MRKTFRKPQVAAVLCLSLFVSVPLQGVSATDIIGKTSKKQSTSLMSNQQSAMIVESVQQVAKAIQPVKKISGTVVDTKGEPLIGVNVAISGTTTGTITDFDGKFEIELPEGGSLTFSYIGYVSMKLQAVPNMRVVLQDDTQKMDEVVVTAMGIKRKAKSLTYATQQVGGNELTRSKETNMINSLQGKTSGLVITPNSSGAGGSAKLLIRGNKSAQGNNQPLIVIDGMPMSNYSSAQMGDGYGGRDGGDALSNINPDDIASVNVLKGASAAALYGSMAANGVVLITTKSGREGKLRVDFSSNITLENVTATPRLQDEYGATVAADGSLSQYSWGTQKLTGEKKGANRVDDFFQTGSTFINSISINGGNKKAQTYLSYANTTANGVMETNKFQRHNMSLKETLHLLDDRLTVTGSLNYIVQKVKNRPEAGAYRNPLTGLYSFPANGDWNNYKQNYAVFDKLRGYDAQQWYMNINNDFSANPYWVLNKNEHKETRDRMVASGSVKFEITKDLNIQGRLSYDKTMDSYDRRLYATTANVICSPAGEYTLEKSNNRQFYGDLLLSYNKQLNADWSVSSTLGTSFMDNRNWGTRFTTNGGMIIPNYFSVANSNKNGITDYETRSRLNAIFGTAQVGYKDMIYMDLTARNDWSSTLAYTKDNNYFYYSGGLTAVVSDMVKMPDFIDLLKFRASYSKVGNGMPSYITNSRNGFWNGSVVANNDAPFKEMQPEEMKSLELGFDIALFNNRLNWDVTYYKTNNSNQYFRFKAPNGTGNAYYYFNAGDIQNTGIETSISYLATFNDDFSWKTAFNLSYNDNLIKKLDDRAGVADKDRLKKVELAHINGMYFNLEEGGSYGDIYAKTIVRDANGVIEVTDKGAPKLSSEYTKVGNVNSKWNLGFSNTFTYKDFQLFFLIDGRIGGDFLDATQAKLSAYGVTQETADARNNGGVDRGDGTKIDAQKYYTTAAETAEFLYDATNFRLREVSLGYTFRDFFGSSKNLSVNFVGRNLFFLYKNAPSDPDMSMSTNNGWSGITYFALPSTRSFGLNIKATF